MGNANNNPSSSKRKGTSSHVNSYLSKVSAKQLSEDDIKELKESFRLFDKDGDGRITAEEITRVLCSINVNITEKEVKAMIREVDNDGNGTIEFEEFCAMMVDSMKQPITEDDMLGAFKIFDKNGDGYISREELTTVLHSLSLPCDQRYVDDLLKATDIDGSGTIDYTEFAAQLIKSLRKS